MKRCPECRRDYYDDSLLYCLDDGSALLDGPASGRPLDDEPETAIMSGLPASAGGQFDGENPTRPFIHTTAAAEPQDSLGGATEKQSFSANRAAEPQESAKVRAGGFDKRLLLALVALAVIVLGGFFGYRYFQGGSGKINSIAVLPLENRSGNSDTDYLSDGLADSLIYRLTQLPNLKVSPTSSVMRYKGKDTDVAQIAKELNVDAVMSGRLVQRGDDLNISVQLIDARTQKVLWAGQYDRKMADLLATQREIATTITQKLELKLAGNEANSITKQYTTSSEAYQLYLKGRYHWGKRSMDDIEKAIDCFQQAIKIDPNFALAYTGISDAYIVMPSYGYLSPNEAFPQARSAAQRALDIDATLADAYAALATTSSFYERDWAKAESEFKRAIELNPNVPNIHYQYGYFLQTTGRCDEGIREFKNAIELEPLFIAAAANLAGSYMNCRQFDLALEQATKTYKLEPNHPTIRYWMGAIYIANGMYPEAVALGEKVLQTDPNDQDALYITGYAYAKEGRRSDAEGVLKKFNDIAQRQYVLAYYLASIYAALGEKDKAFAELERSFTEGDSELPRLKSDPLMDNLRDDPRYKDLLRRMNLPE